MTIKKHHLKRNSIKDLMIMFLFGMDSWLKMINVPKYCKIKKQENNRSRKLHSKNSKPPIFHLLRKVPFKNFKYHLMTHLLIFSKPKTHSKIVSIKVKNPSNKDKIVVRKCKRHIMHHWQEVYQNLLIEIIRKKIV